MNPDFLPDNTRKVLEIFSQQKFIKNYALVGGTALSMQIEHRKSQDIDFIFDGEILNKTSIKRNVQKTFRGQYKIIKEDENYQIDFVINDVKVTFFSAGAVLIPFNVKELCFSYKNINIAPVEIISVLKICTLGQRSTLRDYYDIYYISKYIIPLKDIFIKCKKLLPNLSPVTYSETIIYVDDIPELSIDNSLEPKEIVDKNQISEYFTNEIKKIKNIL
jgi:predicted nucleotidyltransferase component of viral defense system